MTCPLGDLCTSLYILKGQSYKQSILFGTISYSLAVHADQHRAPRVFILWAEPPLMVLPMSTHEGIGVYTPTASPRAPCIDVTRRLELLRPVRLGVFDKQESRSNSCNGILTNSKDS